MVGAREHSELGVGDEPKHLHGMLGTHAIAVTERDEDVSFDRFHVPAREALELQPHFFDFRDQRGPLFRIGGKLVVRILQHFGRKVRWQALKLFECFGIVGILDLALV